MQEHFILEKQNLFRKPFIFSNQFYFMEFKKDKEGYILDKELNGLDKFAINFVKVLNKLKINYVIISGYVSILLGRSRASEDIDMFIEELTYEDFLKLWAELLNKFKCLNTEDSKEAYEDFLKVGDSIRFSLPDSPIPNMEIEFPNSDNAKWILLNKIKVILNQNVLEISKLEQQIAYKLVLGSEKDIEDAKYIYDLMIKELDLKLLFDLLRRFNKLKEFKKYIE